MEDKNVDNALGHSVLPKCEFLTKQNIPLEEYQKCFSASDRTARIRVDQFVRFEVFTAVTMKNAVFWDVAPCRSCVNRRFGGTYCLHLQGRKIHERGTIMSRWLQSVLSYPILSYG
jgi:hypothetical protein